MLKADFSIPKEDHQTLSNLIFLVSNSDFISVHNDTDPILSVSEYFDIDKNIDMYEVTIKDWHTFMDKVKHDDTYLTHQAKLHLLDLIFLQN